MSVGIISSDVLFLKVFPFVDTLNAIKLTNVCKSFQEFIWKLVLENRNESCSEEEGVSLFHRKNLFKCGDELLSKLLHHQVINEGSFSEILFGSSAFFLFEENYHLTLEFLKGKPMMKIHLKDDESKTISTKNILYPLDLLIPSVETRVSRFRQNRLPSSLCLFNRYVKKNFMEKIGGENAVLPFLRFVVSQNPNFRAKKLAIERLFMCLRKIILNADKQTKEARKKEIVEEGLLLISSMFRRCNNTLIFSLYKKRFKFPQNPSIVKYGWEIILNIYHKNSLEENNGEFLFLFCEQIIKEHWKGCGHLISYIFNQFSESSVPNLDLGHFFLMTCKFGYVEGAKILSKEIEGMSQFLKKYDSIGMMADIWFREKKFGREKMCFVQVAVAISEENSKFFEVRMKEDNDESTKCFLEECIRFITNNHKLCENERKKK